MSEGHVYTFPVQVRLAEPIKDAEHARQICMKMEEAVQMGFEYATEADVNEAICLSPHEGIMRHMTTQKE